jgi:hypothetical protein
VLILPPPFAQERLRLRGDGRVALELKTAWHDGTRELIFEPLELLERLAAMTPRPETNLLICHGVLAPRAGWRERVVAPDPLDGPFFEETIYVTPSRLPATELAEVGRVVASSCRASG